MQDLIDIDFQVVPLRAVLILIELMCSDCQARARSVISDHYPNSYAGPKTHDDNHRPMTDIIKGVAMERNLTPGRILSRCRHQSLVSARRRVCQIARENGYTYPEIGKAMNLHHTSVLHLVTSCDKTY